MLNSFRCVLGIVLFYFIISCASIGSGSTVSSEGQESNYDTLEASSTACYIADYKTKWYTHIECPAIVRGGYVEVASKARQISSGGKTQGTFIVVTEEVERAVSGRKIRISILARASKINGSNEFAVAYSTAQVGNSGWKKFKPLPSFKEYSFIYSVPKQQKMNCDYIGVWGDVSGLGKSIEIKYITIDIVDPGEGKE